MIKKIKSEGVEYFYVINPLSSDFDSYRPYNGENIFKELDINDIDGIRMVLVPNPIYKEKYLIEYLFWIFQQNLKELDEKVIDEKYTDNDFENAIKVYYENAIHCQNCHNEYRGFVVDHGNPYIGNKDLLKKKIDKIFKTHSNLKCPNCKSDLRITVLKFLI